MKLFKEFFLESLNVSGIKLKYKEVLEKFNVYEFEDKISLDLIVVKEKNRGIGTSVMKELCSYADSKNKVIILSPSDDFGGNVKKLIEFYKRFGFVVNDGKYKIFGIFERMYRLPNDQTKEQYKSMWGILWKH